MTKKLFLLLLALAPPAAPRALEIQYGNKDAVQRESPAKLPVPIGEFLVIWPTVDLRRDPKQVLPDAAGKKPYAIDELQETQLLYGESVVAYEAAGGWVKVEAPEQPEYTHNDRWQGYPGWVPAGALAQKPGTLVPNAMVIKRYARVRKSRWSSKGFDLPMGARVFVPLIERKWLQITGLSGETGWLRENELIRTVDLPTRSDDARVLILAAAKQFLGEPYYWGGRAGHRKKDNTAPSGIDCSALANISYRVAGYEIPRDSHEQFMASRPVDSVKELRPGDLIFLAKEAHPDRMTHVMIYAGGEEVIEAVHEFNIVRRITITKKLGQPLSSLKPGAKAAGYVVYWGRLLP